MYESIVSSLPGSPVLNAMLAQGLAARGVAVTAAAVQGERDRLDQIAWLQRLSPHSAVAIAKRLHPGPSGQTHTPRENENMSYHDPVTNRLAQNLTRRGIHATPAAIVRERARLVASTEDGPGIDLRQYPGRNINEQAQAWVRKNIAGADKWDFDHVWQLASDLVRDENARVRAGKRPAPKPATKALLNLNIDLARFAGRNDNEKAQSYIRATVAGADKWAFERVWEAASDFVRERAAFSTEYGPSSALNPWPLDPNSNAPPLPGRTAAPPIVAPPIPQPDRSNQFPNAPDPSGQQNYPRPATGATIDASGCANAPELRGARGALSVIAKAITFLRGDAAFASLPWEQQVARARAAISSGEIVAQGDL